MEKFYVGNIDSSKVLQITFYKNYNTPLFLLVHFCHSGGILYTYYRITEYWYTLISPDNNKAVTMYSFDKSMIAENKIVCQFTMHCTYMDVFIIYTNNTFAGYERKLVIPETL